MLNIIFITMLVSLGLLVSFVLYCLGYIKGFRDFEKMQNDYGNKLADLFLDYINRSEN